MQRRPLRRCSGTRPLLAAGCAWLAAFGAGRAAVGPAVEFVQVPPFGSFNDLTGRVWNAAPADYRVVVYIHVGGWWIKPNTAAPLTVIQPDGSWTCDITTGGVDETATRIAAFLVPAGYAPPLMLGDFQLPAALHSNAVAEVTVERDNPAVRTLAFSGLDWTVKASTGPVGPGPNHFSDSTNNVWLDAQGRLHLRITHEAGQWRCAEVVTRRTFGHGTYRFWLDSTVDDLDPNVVAGLFTWSDDPAEAHREIDIEFARWGVAADTNNAQFVVQPHQPDGHLVRWPVPAGEVPTAHRFRWQTNQVTFLSARGTNITSPAPVDVLSQWTYALEVPTTADENVRLNLWLFEGAAPQNGQPAEVIVSRFEFVPDDSDGDGLPDTWELRHGFDPHDPADAAADADGDGRTNLEEFRSGTHPRRPNSSLVVCETRADGAELRFRFQAVGDRSYAVETRDALTNGGWGAVTNLGPFPFTRMVEVSNPIAPAVPHRFFRIVTPAGP